MPDVVPLSQPVRRIHMELRTGDVLALPGVHIQLEYKKGRVARMVVSAAPGVSFKKIPAVLQSVPSLPI